MTTVYWSLVEVTKDRRFTNLTQEPATKTAHKIDPSAKTATALAGWEEIV